MPLQKSHVYLLLAAVCISSVGVFVKLIGSEIPLMTIVFYRVFFGFLFLLLIVPRIDKNAFKITRGDAKEYFLIGLLYAGALSLSVAAFLFAPVQNVVLLHSTSPFFVLVFAYFVLRERITATKILTLVTALIGLVVMNPLNGEGYFFGNALSLAGAFFLGLLTTEMRKENKSHGIGDVLWFFFFASLLLSPLPFIYGFGNLHNAFLYMLLLGVVSTGLAYLFYNLALEKIEAETASITKIVVSPLSAIALAVLLLSEQLNEEILTGGALLIIAGIYLETHSKKLRKKGEHKRNHGTAKKRIQ